MAGYAREFSSSVKNYSGYLENKSIEDLAVDLRTVARSKPGLFIGGAFALGFLAARFLKSNTEDKDVPVLALPPPPPRPVLVIPGNF